MKVDALPESMDLRTIPEFARQVESLGFDGIWVWETTQDSLLALTLVAEHTTRIEFGTAITLAFVRSPMSLAYSAWALQDYSGGRLLLGLGPQVKAHIERRFSAAYDPPGPRMREVNQSLRAIFDCWQNGTPLNYRGKFYNFTLMPPAFNPGPIAHPRIPLFTAGVGPHMCRMAGEVFDGLHVHPLISARYLEEVLIPNVEEGLRKSGRSRQDFCVSLLTFSVSGADPKEEEAARKAVRDQIAFYGTTPAYRAIWDLHGWGEMTDKLRGLATAGQWDQMGDLITDEMLDTFAVVAPPDRIAKRVNERFNGLVDRISFRYLPRPYGDVDFWHHAIRTLRG